MSTILHAAAVAADGLQTQKPFILHSSIDGYKNSSDTSSAKGNSCRTPISCVSTAPSTPYNECLDVPWGDVDLTGFRRLTSPAYLEDEEFDIQDCNPWASLDEADGQTRMILDGIEERFAKLKELYKTKHGEDVEAEELDSEEGVQWTRVMGNGLPTVEELEKSLEEAKAIYSKKHGEDVDAEESESDEGVQWMKVVGSGLSTVVKLEASLEEAKIVYQNKWGEDVDTEECDTEESVQWTKVVGSGWLTKETLQKSSEEHLDEESADESFVNDRCVMVVKSNVGDKACQEHDDSDTSSSVGRESSSEDVHSEVSSGEACKQAWLGFRLAEIE